ncbi:phage late control D family protein [Neisseria musculi]|uniref:Phage late control protein D family protein n=1 Tax=Neisseria musculi TaxID=1815583 RepID=A0A7H1MCS1_9NEIS|nr:contractile injection system protein, VgrG/Pvc8 family [Neisseria musculi]QNT59436.1 phage late control D family protein [Neisseria musculi]
MDALSAFLKLNGLAGGGNTHPVTKPDFTLKYGQKDITGDVEPYLLSLTYTDYLGGQSDELEVTFEDTDGRWLRGWYPEQGDALNLSLGDQFTGLVDLGSFEIAEIEYAHPPSVVSLKALATGITKANRTLQAKAYEKTTLDKIVRMVAGRLKLKVTGEVEHIDIERVTQYQERDIEFLARLAKQYGHTFKIVGDTLVFMSNAKLAEREPVAELLPADMIRVRLRDLIKGVPDKAAVSGYDPKTKTKTNRTTTRQAEPRRKKAKHTTSGDTLKIIANKGESQAQVNARADAALAAAQEEQCAGSVTVFGHAKLVAGQVVVLQNHGKFSGRYLVRQARHSYERTGGYTTELEIKMLEYIPEEKEADDAARP